MGKLTFIIGGARSGKSSYTERIAAGLGQRVLYVATAQPSDEEMAARIRSHQARRPAGWQTRELSAGVGRQLMADPPDVDIILIDCLTVLVSNLVLQASSNLDEPDVPAATVSVQAEVSNLVEAIRASEAHWFVISNEVGQGLVPPYPVGRLYRDLLGWANQRLAQEADEVIWMAAGIPVPIGQYRRSENSE
ncbi:MAG TPA: bifunctional adenosylcobinamide kinase/adenosylcobinamide-phosphate guanylyltransferase [Anaerolineales bacterium]|nr:bifunctional adenosylcobinamide kinase/adenosylcobinamide-phosphate guanylyltransferase [Anaerolineales bacterium]